MLTQAEVDQFHRDGFLPGGACLTTHEVAELCSELERVIADRDNPDAPQPALLRNMLALTDEQCAAYERAIAENTLPKTEEVEQLRQRTAGDDSAVIAILRARLKDAAERREVWQVVNIWMASAPFRRLLKHPKMTAEVAQLTDARELRVWHDQIQYKPAALGGETAWHQDAPAWPVIEPMTEVSAWVALDDVDESNGCMSMVPGSHMWGDNTAFLAAVTANDAMPSSFESREVRVVRRPVLRGEVHYHHALTWHGSHANTSGRPRRAIAIHYMLQGTRFVATGEHTMKRFIDVPDGAPIQGDSFPVCYLAPAV
jgi:hypothetical protein